MSGAKYLTIGAQYRASEGAPVVEHLDLLALKWSERLGKAVSRAEVIKALLEAGLEAHPIDGAEAARLRGLSPAPARERPVLPKLRLATIDGQRLLVEEKGCGDAGIRTPKRGKHQRAA